jgi:two-component system response regulator YesN
MEKLKVLIVDDEYLIRNLLRRKIDWEKQGMTIVGEASNAHEALDMVDKLVPDIIFTDICMPSVDGIDFSAMVMKRYPSIKIVIVTGHDEFEFARRSIKLGISDFILKPIQTSELLSVTDKLRNEICEERKHKVEFEKLKEELKQNLPFLREKFLNRWCQQLIPEKEIREKLSLFRIPFGRQDETFQIAVIEVSFADPERTGAPSLLLSMQCRKKAESFWGENTDAAVFTDALDRIVILADVGDQSLEEHCETLQRDMICTYKCFVCVGVGKKHENLDDVPLGYQEACRALNYKTLVGKNQVVCYKDIAVSDEQPYRRDADLLEELHLYVGAGSARNAAAVLKKILRVPSTDVQQIRLAAMDVLAECKGVETEQKINDGYAMSKDTLTAVLLSDNLPDIEKSLEKCVVSLADAIRAKNSTTTGRLIEQVEDYLDKNLANPKLGLSDTAAAFFVSPGHLGRLFKKETGQTFVEYLTTIRIKRAQVMLKTTELRGYQVGEQVGIPDAHYFSILFKKYVGQSINEYRNSLKNNV